MSGCTCGGTIFTDSMCRYCLIVVLDSLEKNHSEIQEKLWELESDIEQVEHYLNTIEEEETEDTESEDE